jgi:sugar phosphate isomerase/epimerase
VKLGFLTACLPSVPLHEVAAWAAANGYETLEVAAWPATAGNRPFTAAHIRLDTGDQELGRVRDCIEEHGLEISSLGIPTVGTFIGRDPGLSVAANLRCAEGVFPPLVDHAGQAGVKLVIENCVMEGWHPDGYPGNLAYSPELWEWMFSLGLYLNFDPSHLLWLGIDPIAAVRPYVDRIAHVQAKDIELFPAARNRYGFFGKAVDRTDPWDVGWWRYRVPGLGQVDWPRLIDVLYEGGYDGAVSVEHEDPVWGGDDLRVKLGLQIAHRTLRPLIIGAAGDRV